MQGAEYLIRAVKVILTRLDDQSTSMLNETEKVIITSCFKKASGYAKKFTEVITIYKSINWKQQNEK